MSDSMRPRRREFPDLNVTPLIDVVLSLILFFMLSTTFNKASEIQIALPEAKNGSTTAEEPPVPFEVSIDGNGRYFVNKQAISEEGLVYALEQAAKNRSENRQDITLEINADAKTTHQAVISAMDAARQIGILRFAFKTMKES